MKDEDSDKGALIGYRLQRARETLGGTRTSFPIEREACGASSIVPITACFMPC